jgi:hypothetical protein
LVLAHIGIGFPGVLHWRGTLCSRSKLSGTRFSKAAFLTRALPPASCQSLMCRKPGFGGPCRAASAVFFAAVVFAAVVFAAAVFVAAASLLGIGFRRDDEWHAALVDLR